jgi:hypothetical protein
MVFIVHDIKLVVDGGASTVPDHVVEAFPNDVSKLTASADGSRFAIHGNIEFVGTVLV